MSDSQIHTVMIVDDQKLNLHILKDLLSKEHAVVTASSGNQALAIARSENIPDIILLDIMMPDLDGYQTIKELKSSERTMNIPVIFISALDSAEDEEKGFRLGAVDYITKPYHPTVVKARVRTHLQIVRQRKLLENIALLDALTEIPNRRSYEQRIELEWGRSMRNRTPISITMVDVDFFKQFNDNYGHACGDEALKKVAASIQASIRRSADLAARYGGEEFICLLPETGITGGQLTAELIRSRIEGLCIQHDFSSAGKHLTVSIGGVTLIASPQSDFNQATELADQMLYQAKDAGRNQVKWKMA